MASADPTRLLFSAHAIQLTRDIEEQMTARAKDGFRPLITVLHMAKLEAAEAFSALCEVNPSSVDEVRRLQNQIARFTDLVRFLRRIVAAGLEAEDSIGDEDREELESLLAPPTDVSDAERDAEMARLGINTETRPYVD